MKFHEMINFFISFFACCSYVHLIRKCNRYENLIDELEKENEDLRNKIEWGVHNM